MQNMEIQLNKNNIQNICRTCLKLFEQSQLYSLGKILNKSIAPEKLLESYDFIDFFFEKLLIKSNDHLPQKICSDCISILRNISQFYDLCENSQKSLKRYFASESNLTRKEIEFLSIGRIEYLEVNDTDARIEERGIDENDDNECNEEHLEYQFLHEPPLDDSIKNCKEKSLKIELNCRVCGKTYNHQKHLVRHLLTHNLETKANIELETALSITPVKDNNSQTILDLTFACKFCKIEFFTSTGLNDHLQTSHTKDRPHLCPICAKSFSSISNRNTHLQSHNKNDAFKCDVCSQGFKSKVYLRKHIKSLHTTANHECHHCGETFNNTNKYEYHLKSHDPNKKYKCKFCDKSFLQHHHLDNHERTHTGLRPYLCNICGKNFKQECNFKLHLRIHSGLRPYLCTICNKDFIQRGSYVLHMRQHNGIKPYQCEHCGKNFIQKSSLTVHLRTHTGEKPYQCNMCDKAFVQIQQLKYHKHSIHNGPPVGKIKRPPKIVITNQQKEPNEEKDEEPSVVKTYQYTCSVCNKGFKLPSSLSTHMKIHTEERKHVCNQCGNSFKRAEHLRIHINGVHLKHKPYACDICFKRFAQSGDRNNHMRRHTGEKPHSCSYCNKSFRLMKALRAHMRIHTGEKPFQCEICKEDFMTYTALATHTNIKHNMTEESSILRDDEVIVEIIDESELEKLSHGQDISNVEVLMAEEVE